MQIQQFNHFMKINNILIILLGIFLAGSAYSQDTIKPNYADKYMGKNVVIIGTVDQITHTTKAIYLNLGGFYPKNTFAAVIFSKNFDSFKDIESYLEKTVYISGTIKEFNGKPEIIIESRDQIK